MSEITPEPRSVGDLGICIAGPAIWAAHLVALYGGHALICARMPAAHSAMSPLAAIATALALVSLLGLTVFQWRHVWPSDPQSGRFLRHVALALSGLSAFAVVLETLPLAFLQPCS